MVRAFLQVLDQHPKGPSTVFDPCSKTWIRKKIWIQVQLALLPDDGAAIIGTKAPDGVCSDLAGWAELERPITVHLAIVNKGWRDYYLLQDNHVQTHGSEEKNRTPYRSSE